MLITFTPYLFQSLAPSISKNTCRFQHNEKRVYPIGNFSVKGIFFFFAFSFLLLLLLHYFWAVTLGFAHAHCFSMSLSVSRDCGGERLCLCSTFALIEHEGNVTLHGEYNYIVQFSCSIYCPYSLNSPLLPSPNGKITAEKWVFSFKHLGSELSRRPQEKPAK